MPSKKQVLSAIGKAKPNLLDRAIQAIDPIRGAQRLKAKQFIALSGGYDGASRTRKTLTNFNPGSGDADSDFLPDSDDLRGRCRDLVRNAPIATGAINTKVTSVVGSGIKALPRIDRTVLGISDEQADILEKQIEREWKLFSESKECDAARQLTFYDFQSLSWRATLESGDCFVTLPYVERAGCPYGLKLQLFEADRVSNPNYKSDTARLSGGISKDRFGAPILYHFTDKHPGAIRLAGINWKPVEAYNRDTGRPNVLHLFKKLRPGQSRGVPDLAPIVEILKQLDTYTDAEINAAVVSAMFTVFVKSEDGDTNFAPLDPNSTETTTDSDYQLGSGAMLSLAQNEDIEIANPNRPNTAFDGFVLAVMRQIGVALEIPFELLIKHFTASYSASQAAFLEAWRYFMSARKWLVMHLCEPVYEAFFEEAVLKGRISAPGFIGGDAAIRRAYLGAEWVGPPRGQIDELKAVKAAKERISEELSTRQDEAAAMGRDWETTHPQRTKEERLRRENKTSTDIPVEMPLTIDDLDNDD